MAGKGPAPQPAAIAKQKGYYQKSKHGDEIAESGLVFLKDVPDPPDMLNERGQKAWVSVLAANQGIDGWISGVDLPILEQYCYQYQIMCEAYWQLEENGKVKGDRVSPWWRIYQDALKMFLAIGRDFGLTPGARTRIKLDKAEQDLDNFKDLLI